MSTAAPPLSSLRPATPEDLAFLVDLRRRTMVAHLAAMGIAPSEEQLVERVLVAYDCAHIILLAGRPAGLLKVVRDGDHWELVQIQLAPEVQGKGLGAELLRRVVAEARGAGATLRLSVLKANPARRLYERLGFAIVGEEEHAYSMQLGS